MSSQIKIELTEQQIRYVIVTSLRQSLQAALTPLDGAAIDHDLVDSIKQVCGIYMDLDAHKALMQEAALYELAQAAVQQGSATINPGGKDDR